MPRFMRAFCPAKPLVKTHRCRTGNRRSRFTLAVVSFRGNPRHEGIGASPYGAPRLVPSRPRRRPCAPTRRPPSMTPRRPGMLPFFVLVFAAVRPAICAPTSPGVVDAPPVFTYPNTNLASPSPSTLHRALVRADRQMSAVSAVLRRLAVDAARTPDATTRDEFYGAYQGMVRAYGVLRVEAARSGQSAEPPLGEASPTAHAVAACSRANATLRELRDALARNAAIGTLLDEARSAVGIGHTAIRAALARPGNEAPALSE